MALDFDTFLTTLYTIIDDLYQIHFAPHRPSRPGPKPKMSDAEVLTLTILNQWRQQGSQRSLVRRTHAQWLPFFPQMLSQSAFNKRCRDLLGVLARLPALIAQLFGSLFGLLASHHSLDGLPIPLMKRFRGEHHRLFAMEAQVGKGGSGKSRYYGCKAMLSISSLGLLTGCVLAPANSGERWSVEAMFRKRAYPHLPGPTAQEMKAVLGPSRKPQGKRRGPTGPMCTLGAGQSWKGGSVPVWRQHAMGMT